MLANERLTLAIQKRGRLSDGSLNLLQRCGFERRSFDSALFYQAPFLPLDILLVRDDDIPNLIQTTVCDLGIVGENCLQEQENPINPFERVKALGFAKCRLSIALPQEENFTSVDMLKGKIIATSYPTLLQRFLTKNNIQAKIVVISGSVEIAPQLKMADAICDLVSTGKTLAENNLKEVMTILKSQAVLFKSKLPLSKQKQDTLEIILKKWADLS